MVKSNQVTPSFFSDEQKQRLVAAIRKAEEMTSGEIRIHLEKIHRGQVMDHAVKTFERLGMTKTLRRNGILFYLSLRERSFAVLGDIGIHEKVGDVFWQEIRAVMEELFAQGKFEEGLSKGVLMAGEKLGKYFPREDDDQNELPDEIE